MLASNVISLSQVRENLAARFPEMVPMQNRAWEAEWPALEGAILLGAVAEICSEEAVGQLFLERVLQTVRSRGEWAGIIDPARSFDLQAANEGGWEKVLLVFPKNVEQAMKVADALLRDGNLPLVLLGLQGMSLRSLGGIPASTWHRFQRLAERSGTALVVLTPQPLVEAARVRVTLCGRWGLEAMRRRRSELLDELRVQIFRRGFAAQPAAKIFTRSA